ncbi:MAG TPA: two-component regulator propeller domain-containing protein [Pyrinomonadaceae bacterium]|nr:two-component regulator propeller domain-containing protein [Pyrinomonadaceae bacterium]
MRRILRTAPFFCLISLGLFPARALAQYRFDNWTIDDGLPQNSVSAILQTRDGYLWLTTAAGLVRFDGLRFTVFDRSNTKGLNSVRFSTLFEDDDANLWIGTEDGGLTRLRNGTFTTFTTQDGLPHNQILKIWRDERGGILIMTVSGLVRWQRDQFLPYQGLPGIVIDRNCYRVQTGAFWCADAAGLHRIKDDQITTYTSRDGLASLYPSAVYEDRESNVWLAGAGGEVDRLQQNTFTHYTTKDGLPKERITSISQDRQGNLWFITRGGELLQFQNNRFVTYATTERVVGSFIAPFYEDREGNLWLGSADHGLRRLRKDVIAFYSVDGQLAQTKPYPLIEDRTGDLWIGTLGGGLYRYRAGNFTHYAPLTGGVYSTVSALYEDRDGRLWMGGTGAISSFQDGRFVENRDRFGLTTQLVRVMLQDRAGRFWIGTDHGLIKYENERATIYTAQDGLPAADIISLLEDHAGQLWIGSHGGLSRFQDGRFVSYTEQNGLPSNHVRSLYQDSEDTIWIGTYDGGLVRLRDGKFTRYTVADGLFNSGVFSILEDRHGNLWMSCNRGIYSVSKQQLNDFAAGKISAITSVAYGKGDGLLNAECNGNRQPAGWQARDGRLWFPTQGGVAVVDPAAILTNPLPPPVVIEEALLDGKTIDLKGTIQINPGQENLEIRYTCLSFIKSENVRFKYQLAGVDKDWVEAGTRRSAYYAHLPPGAYTFRVIAANSDGVWNNEGTSLGFRVRPPFWRTWWFLSLVTLFVFGGAVLVYERRLVRLRRAHKAQESFSRQLIESQEQHRKRVAGELHDSLGQSLAIIESRAALSLSQPEDHEKAIEQMGEISAAAIHAIDEVREIAYNLRPYQLDRLGLTRALETMLNRTVDSNAIKLSLEIDQVDGIFEKESEINLYRIVQESVGNILKHADATEAKVAIKKDKTEVEILIQDNGKGFNPEAASLGEPGRGGFGLFGIAERVRMMKGQQVIRSAPGAGTTITVKFDLNQT